MELEIEAFRCFRQRSFRISTGLTLVQGTNGTGKSTLFQAIEWCLYGVGQPKPRTEKKPKGRFQAKATLRVPSMGVEVTRAHGPKHLMVRYKEQDWVDQEGQEILHGLFGSHAIWQATCYIRQEQRSGILEGRKDAQMQALHALIFADLDPSEVLKRLDVKRKETQQQRQIIKAKVEGLRAGVGEVQERTDPPEEIEQMLDFVEEELRDAQGRQKRRERALWEIQEHRKAVEEVETALNKYPVIEEENLERLEQESQELSVLLPKYEQVERVRGHLERIDGDLQGLPEPTKDIYTNEELVSLQELAQAHKRQKEIRDALVGVDEERVKSMMGSQSLLRAYLDLPKAEEEASLNTLRKTLESLRTQLHEAKQNLNVLQCPCCQVSLRLGDGVLKEVDGKPVKAEDVRQVQREITRVEERIRCREIVEKREKIEAALEKRGCPKDVSSAELNRAPRQLSMLEQVQDLSPLPMSPMTYAKEMKAWSLRKERVRWEKEWSGEEVDIEKTRKRLQSIRETLLKGRKIQQFRQGLLERQRNLAAKDLPEPEEDMSMEIDLNEEMAKDLREKLHLARAHAAKAEKIAVLRGMETEADQMGTHLTCLDRINAVFRGVQSDRVDQALEQWNAKINQLLPEMFEEQIEIQLRARKETKASVRNELHCTIWLHGDVVSGLSGLSVGQASRVSMAMNVALFSLCPCPFLLFDETFAPVDSDVHDRALYAIRKALPPGTMLLCSSHLPSGVYDHVLHLQG